MGFSRRQRLLRAAEFEAVFEHRRAVRTHYFQVLGKPNETGFARLGMIVSKKLFSRAVDRNHVRRQIREAFRHLAPGLPALDLIVRPLRKPGPSSRETMLQDLLSAFERAVEKCSPGC